MSLDPWRSSGPVSASRKSDSCKICPHLRIVGFSIAARRFSCWRVEPKDGEMGSVDNVALDTLMSITGATEAVITRLLQVDFAIRMLFALLPATVLDVYAFGAVFHSFSSEKQSCAFLGPSFRN